MARIKGDLFRAWAGPAGSGALIPFEVTSSFEITNELLDTSDKDDGGYASKLDGKRDYTLSITANYDPTNSEVQAIIDKMTDTTGTTEQDVLIGQNGEVGDIGWQGKMLISSISFSAGNGELVTVDISLSCNSPLAKVTKS